MTDQPAHPAAPLAVGAAWVCGVLAAVRLLLYGVAPDWSRVGWAHVTSAGAAAVLVGALSLGAHAGGRRALGALLGVVVALAGAASLAGVVTRSTVGPFAPYWRIPPSTAASLVLAGVALATVGVRRRAAVRVAVVLASVLLGLVLVASLGHDPWRWFDEAPSRLRMVPLTGVLLAGIGLGALALAAAGEPVERRDAPSWIPVALAVGFVTVALTLWSALLLEEKDHLHESTQRAATVLRAALQRERDLRVQAITRLAARWNPSRDDELARWRTDSGFMIEHLGLRWMALAAPDGTRRAETPERAAPPADDPRLVEAARRAISSAPDPVVVHLPDGDLLIAVASRGPEGPGSVLQAAVSLSALLRVATATPLVPTFAFALEDGDHRIVSSDWADPSGEVVEDVVLADRRLRLRVAPGAELQVFHRSIVPGAVLGAMILLVLLTAVFARRAGLQAESERRLNEDLRRAQRAARVGSWDLDVSRNTLRWSDELCRLHGVSPASAPSTLEGFVDRVVAEDRDRVLAAIGEAYSEGTPFAFDYRVTNPDGSERMIEARGEVELDRHGRVAHLVGTGRDVTEKRAMEERLLRQREQLEEQNRRVIAADRKKTEFLANMSHELRTPLNSIIGFTELLHDGRVGPLTADQKDFLADVLASARHLLDLIGEVLDIARVETGHLVLRRERVDLGELVEETVALLRVEASRRGLRLRTEIASDAGSVVTDPSRLRQVLVNFLSNALKFTPEGGTISVRARAAEYDHYRVEVEDTGIGIRREDFPRLFEEFEPLDASASKRYPGTGLGLALSRRIVEALGGTVGVESEVGRGSTFHAVLPRVPPVQRQAAASG